MADIAIGEMLNSLKELIDYYCNETYFTTMVKTWILFAKARWYSQFYTNFIYTWNLGEQMQDGDYNMRREKARAKKEKYNFWWINGP